MKQLSTILLMCFSCWLTAQPCDIPPSSLDCNGAPILCSISELDGYCTTLPNFVNPSGPNPLCGSNGGGVPNNSIWFGFVAWDTKMSISVIPSNCTDIGGQKGIQGGIYNGANGCDNISDLVCQGSCTTFPMTLTSSDFIVGEIYYFILDGCAGSVCDISIDLVSGGGSIDTIGNVGPISGPLNVCKNVLHEYTIPEIPAAKFLYWTIDGVLQEDPTVASEKISLSFGELGSHILCIDAANYCMDSNNDPVQYCTEIQVFEGTLPISEKDFPICSGDSVFYKGKYYKDGQSFIDTTTTGPGCTAYVVNNVKEYISQVNNLGDVFLCKGDCFTVTGIGVPPVIFCDTISNAQAIIPNYLGCDSLITFNLKNALAKKDTSFISVTLCDQDSLQYGGLDIDDVGLYYYSVKSGDSCQVVALNVTADTVPNNVFLIKCKNKPVTYRGISYSNAGIYSVSNFMNACKPNMTLIINEIECKGDYDTNQQTGTIDTLLIGKLGAKGNIGPLSTQSQSSVEVELIPNPTSNQIQLISNQPIDITRWQVFNALGQMVLQSNQDDILPLNINVSGLSNGLYYWKGVVNGQQVLRQFMKIE